MSTNSAGQVLAGLAGVNAEVSLALEIGNGVVVPLVKGIIRAIKNEQGVVIEYAVAVDQTQAENDLTKKQSADDIANIINPELARLGVPPLAIP